MNRILNSKFIKFKNWAGSPFRFPNTIYWPAFLASFIFVVIIILQPCGFDDIPHNKLAYFLGYAAIVFMIVTLTTIVFPKILVNIYNMVPKTTRTYILYSLAEFFIISSATWLYTKYVIFGLIPPFSYFRFLLISFVVTISPSMLLVIFLDRTSRKANGALTQENADKPVIADIKTTGPDLITIKNAGKQELNVPGHAFICAMAKGNYTQIHYHDSGIVKNTLLRLTLAELEKQINGSFPFIIRCHRSTLVNVRHVSGISGNAKNYKLIIEQNNLQLPVSRSSVQRILPLIDTKNPTS